MCLFFFLKSVTGHDLSNNNVFSLKQSYILINFVVCELYLNEVFFKGIPGLMWCDSVSIKVKNGLK